MKKAKEKKSNAIWSVILGILSILYMYPIVMILFNSLKTERAISTNTAFKLPTAETFAGLENYVNAINAQGFLKSLGYSLFITVTSVVAILLFCAMCSWYITRVKTKFAQGLYFLFAFSMVVPFQMVMFTLSQTADMLNLNTPWNIWIIYLGFGAGLAVFMFAGFMKSIPLEVEEASMIDGCNPLQTFFMIVLPMLKPTMVSVGILEAMWVWNDYLLPTLVLDIKKYRTIPKKSANSMYSRIPPCPCRRAKRNSTSNTDTT
jgi:raffinose/stachyose/melibiose transport system permease protein